MAALYWAGLLREDHLVLYHGDGFIIGWDESSLLLSYFAIGTVLVLRFTRSAQEEQRLSTEMESAHQVQAQLVPLHLPTMPHFHFEAAYLAASEVGGDFYQVFPQSDGGVLVAIGDVSGKGLKAAMLGSQVVGALRSLAQENLPPSQILARLNRQLVASSDGGFVTCSIARIDANGETTIANAGHLAPFRDGEELPVAGSLPLGLAADAAYDELIFALHEGETLTFYTDGILEARNSAGELYGFERLAALVQSHPTIERMVEEACNFGQQDDITIFRVTRLAQSAPAHAARLSLATQIAGS